MQAIRALKSLFNGKSRTSSVVQTIIVRLALLAVTFGTGVVAARSLAAAGRGEQAALAIWPFFLAGFATFGIPTALLYQSRRGPNNAGRLYTVASISLVAIGFLVALIGAAAMPLLLHGYTPTIVGEARWFMLFAPQCLLAYAIRAHLEARGEFLRSILGQFVPNIFTLFALLVLAYMHALTPVTSALAYAVPAAIQTLWLGWRLYPDMLFRFENYFSDMRALFSYGLRSYGTDLINALSTQLDLAVIVAFLSPTALGLYTVALSVSRLVNVVQQSIAVVLFPHASSLCDDDAIDVVGRAARLSAPISLGLACLLLIAVPPILPLFYGKSFAGALAVLPLLTLEAVVSGFATLLSQAFSATGRPIVVSILQACWISIVIGLLFILVPMFSITGAAMALALGSVARLALTSVFYATILHKPFPSLIPNIADFRYIRDVLMRLRSARSDHRLTDRDLQLELSAKQ